MTSVFGRSRLFFGFVGLLSVASMDVLAAPTVALKAVAINGSPITATRSISVVPGDTITAEIFLFDWTTTVERLLSYQTAISRDALVSGTRGKLLPLGWDAPLAPADAISCGGVHPPCPAEFPVCELGDRGVCIGLDHDPSQGVFIGSPTGELPTRPDWVFIDPNANPPASLAVLTAIDFRSPDLRYGAVLISAADAPLYNIPPKYGGSLIVQVSEDACGTFNLRVLSEDGTVLTEQSGAPFSGLVLQRLAVTVTSPGAAAGQCSCLNIINRRYDANDVPNCTIDARQPADPAGGITQIPNSVTFTFDCADTTSIASTSNFTINFSPTAFTPILATATSNGSDVTVSLSGPMREQSWNCITFNPTGEGVCVGIMPGDVNSDARSLSFDCGEPGEPPCPDGTTGLSDIPALEACLNNPGTCTLFQCDINRSGACTPQDLLREIDLLVGTGFTFYDTKGIEDFFGQVVACSLAR